VGLALNPLYTQLALQIVLPIACGWALRRFGVLSDASIGRITQLAFWLLAPMLLFRHMARVDLHSLQLGPVAMYFLAAALVIAALLWRDGLSRRSGVVALAATYSNNVMIGLPLVGLLFAQQGLVTMLTLLVFHSLVLLTTATLLLEWALARERSASAASSIGLLRIAGSAAIKTVLHPVPLPIAAGLAFGATGWVLPPSIDLGMQWGGMAFAPLALGLVGASLRARDTSDAGDADTARSVWQLVALKNMAMPLLVAALCWASGQRGEGAAVMVLAAALPMGANVMLFAYRYNTAQTLVARAITLSSAASIPVVAAVVWWWR
jgi:malonate transporter and related proteins